MPRPDPADVDRYHHLEGIPSRYRPVLYTRPLRYSAHAEIRYARRVEHLAPEASRPKHINANTMQLLAADVVDGKVVMQVWRAPLEGLEKDLVLAVSDQGKVATVWVVERSDMDGIKRPKQSRAARRAAYLARSMSGPGAASDAELWGGGVGQSRADQSDAPPASPVLGVTTAGLMALWRNPWDWVCRAIRNVLTQRRKKSCLKRPQSPL